jgi:hypothetical protein
MNNNINNNNNNIINEDNNEIKELAPGVFLYKEYKKAEVDNKDIVGIIIWKVRYF